jgi:amino acid transporter
LIILTAAKEEASGAPVETHSSLGYAVGPAAILFLNFSKMVGTGVYSTPSAILAGTGSVGLALIFWTLGFFISLATLAMYLEYASYFPNRSGSEVVYLEQAFPRPRYFFPLTFAVQTVLLSFSASNAIVLSTYLFKANGHVPKPWELKGLALAGYTVAFLLVVFHTRGSYWLSNTIGVIKLITLIFIAITGLVVLGGHTHVKDPHANFRDAFKGSGSGGGYGATTAMYSIIFSYAGFENAFNVVNEIKSPVKTIKRSATSALILVAILYILANVAYFSAVPKAQLAAGKQTVAALFFTAVFGAKSKGLNVLIALSAFGNIIAVLIGQSRLIRECGR